MIKNERQYRITKAQFDDFGRKLHSLAQQPTKTNVHPRIQQAQREAVRSQLDELREELAAYEALQAGQARVLECASLEQLPAALIQSRIAVGLTQRELARRLGMKEQQLQRYEATNYAGASLERIQAVASALGVKVREEVFLPGADVSRAHVVRRATRRRTRGMFSSTLSTRSLHAAANASNTGMASRLVTRSQKSRSDYLAALLLMYLDRRFPDLAEDPVKVPAIRRKGRGRDG